MKKKIFTYFGVTILALIAIVTGINKYQESRSVVFDLALANIEALARDESGECKGGKCEFTDKAGNKCSSCCAEGQRAECDVFGCRCM